MNPELIITRFSDHQDELYKVRYQVFVIEQNVPAEMELDEHDEHCRHALITIDGQPVATGRIDLEQSCIDLEQSRIDLEQSCIDLEQGRIDLEPKGRIGRVAVMANIRKLGLGRIIMDALEQEARNAGLKQVWLHAQDTAVGFYEKLGYHIHGESFMEAGILHFPMDKQL